jgi:hypothetical protein
MDELKDQHNPNATNGFMQDTPPRADVDEILRRKRKAREYKVGSPWWCARCEGVQKTRW